MVTVVHEINISQSERKVNSEHSHASHDVEE